MTPEEFNQKQEEKDEYVELKSVPLEEELPSYKEIKQMKERIDELEIVVKKMDEAIPKIIQTVIDICHDTNKEFFNSQTKEFNNSMQKIKLIVPLIKKRYAIIDITKTEVKEIAKNN